MLEDYKKFLIREDCRKQTIRSYLSHIKLFLKQVKINHINKEIVEKYFSQLNEKYSSASYNLKRSAIKSFLKFLNKNIPLPKSKKVDQKLPEFITEEYFLKEIISVVECIFTNPLKIKAILYFLFYAGIRRGEFDNLKRADIDLERRRAKIFGKGRKERIVIFSKECAEIIRKYFITETEEKNAFNTCGKTVESICYKIKPYLEEINFHAHILRHSMATHCLNILRLDIYEVSKLLGHSSIQTTTRYLGLNLEAIQKKYDKKGK